MKLYSYRKSLILQSERGWGEISPLPGFSRETLEEARAEILSVLQGGSAPTLPSVRFGLFCASKPFDPSPLRIPLSALNIPRPGFSTLKLKKPTQSQIESLKNRFRLRIDCNRGWTLEEALEFAKPFKPEDFDYWEEPVRTFSDLVQFSEITRFPIAADESFRDSPYWKIPTLKAVICKPTLMGEIPSSAVPVILSSSFESSLGILLIARLAQNNLPQGLDTFQDDILQPPLKRENGFLVWEGSDNPIDVSQLCRIY